MTDLPGTKADGSRVLNRENLTIEESTVAIPVLFVESSIFTGFRFDWLTGTLDEAETEKVRLTAGAGCGSPYMNFELEGVGHLVVDMRDVIPVLATTVREMAAKHPERATRG